MTGDQFLPCSIDGCAEHASEAPHLFEGRAICPEHAVLIAHGKCQWCGDEFNPRWHGMDAYASKEGKAYCIDCWTAEGYGYPMKKRAEP